MQEIDQSQNTQHDKAPENFSEVPSVPEPLNADELSALISELMPRAKMRADLNRDFLQ